jgi:hypothetical protein
MKKMAIWMTIQHQDDTGIGEVITINEEDGNMDDQYAAFQKF